MSRTRCVRVLKAEKREEDGEAAEEEDMGEEDVKLVVETVAGCHKENKNLSFAIFLWDNHYNRVLPSVPLSH